MTESDIILDIVLDHIESTGGTYHPDKEFFIGQAKKSIKVGLDDMWSVNRFFDIKILFTHFGKNEFMAMVFIGPLSKSIVDLKIPWSRINREISLYQLLESKESTSD